MPQSHSFIELALWVFPRWRDHNRRCAVAQAVSGASAIGKSSGTIPDPVTACVKHGRINRISSVRLITGGWTMESGGYMGDLSMRNQDLCLDKLGQPTGYIAWYLNPFCHKWVSTNNMINMMCFCSQPERYIVFCFFGNVSQRGRTKAIRIPMCQTPSMKMISKLIVRQNPILLFFCLLKYYLIYPIGVP